MKLPKLVEDLISELSRLPSIGSRTAEKIALHMLKKPEFEVQRFSTTFVEAKKKARYCQNCTMLTESELCDVCNSEKRDKQIVCIVAEVTDLISIERTGAFQGQYHVLHGELSPLDSIGPEHLTFERLWERLATTNEINELILATNPTFEGESTAFYIKKHIREKHPHIKITKLAQGIPQGGSVEYLDHITLGKAMSDRKEA